MTTRPAPDWRSEVALASGINLLAGAWPIGSWSAAGGEEGRRP